MWPCNSHKIDKCSVPKKHRETFARSALILTKRFAVIKKIIVQVFFNQIKPIITQSTGILSRIPFFRRNCPADSESPSVNSRPVSGYTPNTSCQSASDFELYPSNELAPYRNVISICQRHALHHCEFSTLLYYWLFAGRLTVYCDRLFPKRHYQYLVVPAIHSFFGLRKHCLQRLQIPSH